MYWSSEAAAWRAPSGAALCVGCLGPHGAGSRGNSAAPDVFGLVVLV
jgi:hypothetical protein